MRRRVVVVAALVLLALVAVTALVLRPRGTTELTQAEALDVFRERSGSSDPAPGDGTIPSTTGTAGGPPGAGPTAPHLPEPGVYTYTADGEEEVKLGPLPAEHRPLPDTVTAIVVAVDEGCFDWTLNLFAEHTEDTRWCTDGDGLRLASHVKHQRIGPMSPTATMACDPATVRTPRARRPSWRAASTCPAGRRRCTPRSPAPPPRARRRPSPWEAPRWRRCPSPSSTRSPAT